MVVVVLRGTGSNQYGDKPPTRAAVLARAAEGEALSRVTVAPPPPVAASFERYVAGEDFDPEDALARWTDAGLPSTGRVDVVRALLALESPVRLMTVPRDRWPYISVGGSSSEVEVGRLVTTQRRVHAEVVLSKLGLTDPVPGRPGGSLYPVSVHPVEGGAWLFDGHHTLVATAAAGLPVRAEGYSRGADVIAAPRLTPLR